MKKTLFLFFLLIGSYFAGAQIHKSKFYEACVSGDHEICKQYISEGGDINTFFENSETPLMTACRHNQSRIINILISSEAKANLVNSYGMTAMTILRLQMGFNDTFDSDAQSNLRRSYDLMRSFGGKELDFINLITENKDNIYDHEQKIVLQINNDFRSYMNAAINYKTKTYNEHQHNGDDITYTDHMNNYTAKYDETGQLAFFQHKNETIAEWHDNGNQAGFERQYYFKDGNLYFYLDTNYSGSGSFEHFRYRYYFNEDKIVVAAVKRFDDWWEEMKDEKDRYSFRKLVNINDIENLPKLDEKAEHIINEFNLNYNEIKDLLK